MRGQAAGHWWEGNDLPDRYTHDIVRRLAHDYEEVENWLWYQSEWLGRGEAIVSPAQASISRIVSSPGGKGDTGTLLPERGVGVATVWIQDRQWKTPWDAKNSLWDRRAYWSDLLAPTGLLEETDLSSERNYMFLAVRVDESDLAGFCERETATVASWFTGGYELESHEAKRELVGPDRNISRRGYERLFMRWTAAVALYNLDSVESEHGREALSEGTADRLYGEWDRRYRLTRCRAAQLFEHCILARRIFRSDGRRIARLSENARLLQSAPVVSRSWRQANGVLSSFAQAEFEMVVAPPAKSAESGDLVRAALTCCGVPALIEDTRRSYDLLDHRLQWARGQWLAVVAVCAFVANAVLVIVKG